MVKDIKHIIKKKGVSMVKCELFGLTPIPLKPRSKTPFAKWGGWNPTTDELNIWATKRDVNWAVRLPLPIRPRSRGPPPVAPLCNWATSVRKRCSTARSIPKLVEHK